MSLVTEHSCAVEGCERPYLARSMCDTHYRSWRRGKLVAPKVVVPKRDRNRGHPKICIHCGEDFVARMSTTQLCSARCRSRRTKQRFPTKYTPPVIEVTRVCVVCNESFERTSKFGPTPQRCSACNVKYRQTKNLEAGYAKAHYRANTDRYKERNRVWKDENREFVRESNVRHANLRRARQAQVPSESYTRQEIGDRDRWTCHLCDKSIDPSLGRRDHLSFSFDHVVPISRGGHDTAKNVRSSHWICNVKRNIRPIEKEAS